jgi:hypothetical protein
LTHSMAPPLLIQTQPLELSWEFGEEMTQYKSVLDLRQDHIWLEQPCLAMDQEPTLSSTIQLQIQLTSSPFKRNQLTLTSTSGD